MTKKTFIEEATKNIYNGLMINLNESFNVSKTNMLAVQLLFKAKLNIEVIQTEDAININNKKIKDLANSIHIETNKEDPTNINLIFFTSGKLEKLLESIIVNELLFTAIYLQSIYRIIDGTYTYEYIMQERYRLSGYAGVEELTMINAYKNAMSKSLKQIKLSNLSKKNINKLEKLEECFNLEPVSEKDLLEIKATKLSKQYKNLLFKAEHYILPEMIINDTLSMYGYQEGNEGTHDSIITSLKDALMKDISSGAKGNAIGALFAAEFEATKVDTKWFKKIKKVFNNYVHQKTSDFDSSWSSINQTYRKIFKSPSKKHKQDRINIILSIDQSGSISARSLSQVLHIIKKKKKHIGSLDVLIHDAAVTQTFNFDNLDENNESEIQKAVGTRYSNGGTSHIDVFRHIEKLSKKRDISKTIYFCFTDGHSDIEDGWTKYTVMKNITTLLLNEAGGRGEQISKAIKATCINLPAK